MNPILLKNPIAKTNKKFQRVTARDTSKLGMPKAAKLLKAQ